MSTTRERAMSTTGERALSGAVRVWPAAQQRRARLRRALGDPCLRPDGGVRRRHRPAVGRLPPAADRRHRCARPTAPRTTNRSPPPSSRCSWPMASFPGAGGRPAPLGWRAMGAASGSRTPRSQVDPGVESEVELSVRNTGSVLDEFSFAPIGMAQGWISIEPPSRVAVPGRRAGRAAPLPAASTAHDVGRRLAVRRQGRAPGGPGEHSRRRGHGPSWRRSRSAASTSCRRRHGAGGPAPTACSCATPATPP